MAGLDVGYAYDEQVWAMRLLAEGAANSDLETDVADRLAIARTYGYPVPLGQVPQSQLPMLSVWRQREGAQRTNRGTERTLTLRIDYWSEASPLEKLEERWPLLHKVWASITSAWRKGLHPAVNDGVDVLGVVGVIEVDFDGAEVRYDFGVGGEGVYPAFLGTIDIRYKDSVLRDYEDESWMRLKELWATYELRGEETDPLTVVEDKVVVPA